MDRSCYRCGKPNRSLMYIFCPDCLIDWARGDLDDRAPKRAVQRGIAERWEANLDPDRAPFTPAELTS